MSLIYADLKDLEKFSGDKFRLAFVTQGHPVHAQQVLRAAVSSGAGEEQIRWRHVAKQLNSYLTRDALHSEIQSNFGTYVQYQFHQHPQVWPDFLPAEWNSLP